MSKPITITQEYIEQCMQEFKASLEKMRLSDGKVRYEKSLSSDGEKATLFFTESAWTKMFLLIQLWDKEIGWHGVAQRYGEGEGDNSYIITDIVVYPQEVTGATVNTDQKEYESWLMSLEDDTFNNLRMHGHSHVNMGTTPSNVDETHWESILNTLDGDMFYIFIIWNKKNSRTIRIYDLAKNILFETADITVKIFKDGSGVMDLLDRAKEVVKEKKWTPATTSQPKYEPAKDKKKEKYNASYGYRSGEYSTYGGYSGYGGTLNYWED